jgi:hypothetical protein
VDDVQQLAEQDGQRLSYDGGQEILLDDRKDCVEFCDAGQNADVACPDQRVVTQLSRPGSPRAAPRTSIRPRHCARNSAHVLAIAPIMTLRAE